jgi:hypothetical protein
MLALIGFGVVICIIMGLYLMQTFGKVSERLERIEARLDALSETRQIAPGPIERLPPPDDDSGNSSGD